MARAFRVDGMTFHRENPTKQSRLTPAVTLDRWCDWARTRCISVTYRTASDNSRDQSVGGTDEPGADRRGRPSGRANTRKRRPDITRQISPNSSGYDEGPTDPMIEKPDADSRLLRLSTAL